MSVRRSSNAVAPVSEAQYRQHNLTADVAQMRFALVLLALPNVLFFAYEAIIGDGATPPWLTLGMRASFLMASVYVWTALPGINRSEHFDRLVIGWSAVGVALLLVNAYARPADYFGHYLFEIFALMTYFAVVPLQPPAKLAVGALHVVGALTILLMFKTPPHPLYLANTVFMLLLTCLAGYLISLRIEKYRRAATFATLELETAARTDALTGVANRRAFMQWADREVARCRRVEENSLAVLLLDIDKFKSVNDAFGHAAGDRLLVEFCRRVQECLRSYDFYARMGGEEFVVGLPRCDLPQAFQVAERIRASIAETPFEVGDRSVIKTVSIGAAVLHPGESEIDGALGRADAAMYMAKRSGRNKVVAEAAIDGP